MDAGRLSPFASGSLAVRRIVDSLVWRRSAGSHSRIGGLAVGRGLDADREMIDVDCRRPLVRSSVDTRFQHS